MIDYESFLKSKRLSAKPVGIDSKPDLHPSLFGFQRDIVHWALRRGRAALFEECGLGKSRQAIEWARCVNDHTGGRVIILTPLAVAEQFVREGKQIGVSVTHAKSDADVSDGISVTNYERMHRFDMSQFAGVVLDESSILKSKDAKTRTALIEAFRDTPFRLACTATPAPNDHVELGNHSEFLGVMSQSEMLSMFFTHDGGSTQNWRLKGHARADFWKWVCSWAVCLTKPSDLGYDNEGYDLPDLRVVDHVVDCDDAMANRAGMLFAFEAKTLTEHRAARKASLPERVRVCSDLANGDSDQWLVWCDLNDESKALKAAIDGAVEVTGSDPDDHKERAIMDFIDGKIRVLVTKPSIAGFGVNLQNCHKSAFVGLSQSFEQWYQATRRIWRFGQDKPVESHIITSSAEGNVLKTIDRKRRDFDAMVAGMTDNMAAITRSEIASASHELTAYCPNVNMTVPAWVGEDKNA